MTADVSIMAALFAGLISFLSPCVLPLVPPYLAFLAGASIERLAEAETKPRVRGARRRRQRDRCAAAVLFPRARDRGRHHHHHHGATLPRYHADCVPLPA